MPESALWSLIVALIMLSFGLALKVAQLTHRLDAISKKSTSAESEIKSLQYKKDEEISDIKKLYDARIKELSDTISHIPSPLKQVAIQQALDEPQVNILKLLFSKNISTDQIAQKLNMQIQTAAYHLEELAHLNMVVLQRLSQQLPGGGGPFDMPSLRKYSVWTLKQPGRKYLLDNKLV